VIGFCRHRFGVALIKVSDERRWLKCMVGRTKRNPPPLHHPPLDPAGCCNLPTYMMVRTCENHEINYEINLWVP
jgi:hypothetical protein